MSLNVKNKMKIRKIIILLFLFAVSLNARDKTSDYYQKIDKAFEIYGAVLKNLANRYVVEIDPEVLMLKGIEGMLDDLDPYTVYMPDEDNTNDLDILTKGGYVGFGIVAGTLDSMLTVLEILPGSPNKQSGLRVGDKIYKIDSTILLYEPSSRLHEFSAGKTNTFVDVYVFRDGIDDTLKITLERNKIIVKSISDYRILGGDVAYIKIDRFTSDLADEFKEVLSGLRKKSNIKGLIIDVRNNPGGLLLPAIQIAEQFLPNDIPVVKTRRRNAEDLYTYRTISKNPDTLLPLVVLINRNSASASEILAAALQDLDRAVIVGERSYGKGLVQSVVDLPYNGMLKLTTAKYYMPSGRCIQRLDYPVAKENGGLGLHYDSVYYTKNRRPVYESSGVQPDVEVKADSLNDYQYALLEKYCFFKFANIFAAPKDTLQRDFIIGDTVLRQFRQYLRETGFKTDDNIYDRLAEIRSEIDNTKLKKKLSDDLAKLLAKIKKIGDYRFAENTEFIIKRLRYEILRRFYPDINIESEYIKDDNFVRKALEIIKTERYLSILSPEVKKLN